MLTAARATLAEAGFDLVHDFDTAAIAHVPALAMLDNPSRRLGVLVGNTRALWPKFLAERDRETDEPLDRYTETTLARAFPGERVWFAHVRYDGAWLPIQRLADAVGFAHLAPSHLVIHPTFGPWIALRAVVALAGDPPVAHPRLTPPCHCGDACTRALARAMSTKQPADWIALRDSCTVGRNHRYGDDQLHYHYIKDRSLLR